MRSIRRSVRIRSFLCIAAALLALAGGAASELTIAKTSTVDVHLYFLVDGKIATTTRTVSADSDVPGNALNALLAGPQINEFAIGRRTALPIELAIVKPLAIDANSKIATVSLPSIFTSKDPVVEAQRTAQIVYTLTQFPGIMSVSFMIDGRAYKPLDGTGQRVAGPVTRVDFERIVPAILIESANGKNPLHIEGTANVFEAEFGVELFDALNGKIASGNVMASSGTGTSGTFSKDIPYKVLSSQIGTLVAYELSAKDGSRINIVAIPVALVPG